MDPSMKAASQRPSVNERAQSLFERLTVARNEVCAQADRFGGATPQAADPDGRPMHNDNVASLIESCHYRMDDIEAEIRRLQSI